MDIIKDNPNLANIDPIEYAAKNAFMAHNHMYITEIGTERSEIRMDVFAEGLNIMGRVHGGLLYSMADVVTGLTARADGRRYVTQSAHANFISNISSGTVIARGLLVRRGRTVTIVRGVVTDENGKLLLESTIDMFCLDA